MLNPRCCWAYVVILLSNAWMNNGADTTMERTTMTTNAPTPIGSELDGTARPGETPAGFVNRYSPAAQVGIVAAAIIPTIVLYVAYWLIPLPDNPYLNVAELAVFCLLYGVYFVAIIRVVNRYPQRRDLVWALAIVTVLVDTAVSCAPELPLFYDIAANRVNSAYVAITVAYVAVWGIARRQSKAWMFGLPFAAFVSWLAQFGWFGVGLFLHPGRSYWWEPWTCFVGSFIIGCLICWAFDLLGRSVKPRADVPSA